MRRVSLLLAALVLVLGIAAAPRHLKSRPSDTSDFMHFESGHIHPAVMTPSGDRLLVVNTPDAHLVVFDVTGGAPQRIAEIPVGLEPISVACVDDSTAWVVNNLSDDVSIVNLNTMHTRQTLRVGDEPSDVVFAGSPLRAYVSISNEDQVKVFDPATLGLTASIPIPARAPQALACDASGAHVYVATFNGGNQTSILSPAKLPNDSIPQDTDFPRDSIPGHGAPKTGLIVQQLADGRWFDFYGNLWNSKIKYTIKDVDVAEIATASNTVSRTFGGIGSTCFNLAVSRTDGRIAVAAVNARNTQRFEARVQGYIVETYAAFVSQAGVVLPRVLNPQIDYFTVPGTQAEADSALGTPTGIAFSQNGNRVYVTALANNRIGVLNPNLVSPVLARVPCVAGPTGIVVDDARGRLYIVGRFYNQLQTLSTTNFSQIALQRLGMNPTPDAIVDGRKFFYGGFTSAHGDQSCASCHLFGDMDNMAWDLGNPNGGFVPPPIPNPLGLQGFDPMKGPMVTQSLRGLPNTTPFHWRGDRADLSAFNPAFVTLMGRPDVLPDSEMAAFSDFVMPLAYPPNPYENLDRSQADAPLGSPSAQRGQDFFINTAVDGPLRCNDCHTENSFAPGTNRAMVPAAVLLESQDIKVPQLRNQYRKTGFKDSIGVVNKRGFGYTHDGSSDRLSDFLHHPRFSFAGGALGDDQRRDMEAYLLSFDSGTAPAIGYEITFDGTNNVNPTAIARMDTLEGQAALAYCDLIAKGRVNGQERGWEFVSGMWKPDKAAGTPITSADLRALGDLGAELTVMGVPPGSGHRMGVDRDRDGYLDGDELDVLSDPGDPASTPANVGVHGGQPGVGFALRGVLPNPFRDAAEVQFTLGHRSRVNLTVYDVLGRTVKRVAHGVKLEAGTQSLRWDGRGESGTTVSAGMYFVRLETEGGQWTRPLVRIR